MPTYICNDCNIRIRLKNLDEGSGSVYAEKCPVCMSDKSLEYL